MSKPQESALTIFQNSLPEKAVAVAAMVKAMGESPLLNALQQELDVLAAAILPEYLDVNSYTVQTDAIVSGLLQSIAAYKKDIKTAMAAPTSLFHSLHKTCTTATAAMLDSIDDSILRATLVAYRDKKEAERKAEEDRLLKAANAAAEAERKRLQDIEDARVAAERKRLESEMFANAEKLTDEGKTKEADALLEKEIHVPKHMVQIVSAPVVFIPTPEQPKGTSVVKKKKAVVVDKAAVIAFVAAHPEWMGLIEINEVQLRVYAKQFGNSEISPVSGIEFVDDNTLRVGQVGA